jgi:hypothetical protein
MEYGKATLRQRLTFGVFVGTIGVLFLLGLILKTPPVLLSERRVPAAFPAISARSLLSGDFMSAFEKYADDSFPFRDSFRAMHAFTVFDIFAQSDKSGLYRDSAVGLGEYFRVDETAFRQTAEKLRIVAEGLSGMNVYWSLIPDKSLYAADYYPGYEHDAAEAIISAELGGAGYIPIDSLLSAESYYRTDLHWNQLKIENVAERILSAASADVASSTRPSLTARTAGEFRGVYAGRYALPYGPDTLGYLDAPELSALYLNDGTLMLEAGPVHDPARLRDVDPYDVFLRGPQAVIEIRNSAAEETGKELYLVRESFGSSLAPLLARHYAKVTVIDLRYIHADLLVDFIDFKPGSDVLFIYGAQMFNNPDVLLV